MISASVLGAGPGWLALDKPSGMSAHNDPEGRLDAVSVSHEMLLQDEELRAVCEWLPSHSCPTPAHRLDKETSGILLLATSRQAATRLQSAFGANGEIEKTYRAVVRGQLESLSGLWNSALTDRAEGRKNPAGQASERKPCTSIFRVVQASAHLTEIEIDLKTGRQHQIRKHAVLARHEVVGDARYGDPRYIRGLEKRFGRLRMMLHAHQLKLHTEKESIELISSVPDVFNTLFKDSKAHD